MKSSNSLDHGFLIMKPRLVRARDQVLIYLKENAEIAQAMAGEIDAAYQLVRAKNCG